MMGDFRLIHHTYLPIILRIRMMRVLRADLFFEGVFFFYHPGHHPMNHPGVILACGPLAAFGARFVKDLYEITINCPLSFCTGIMASS